MPRLPHPLTRRPVRTPAGPLLVAVVLLGLGACGSEGSSSATDPDAGDQPTSVAIEGEWALRSGTGSDGPITPGAGSPVTLTIDAENVSGSSGCNRYTGPVTVEGTTVGFGPLASTQMACEPAAMALEAAYLTALGAVTDVARDGTALVLTGPDVELVLDPVTDEPAPELAGTVWVLDGLVEGETASSVAGRGAELRLAADGTLSGSTGCRLFRGPWTASGDTVTLGLLATDRRACPPGLRAQDEFVLAVLQGDLAVELDGSTLTLTAPSGRGLTYRAR